MSGNELILLAPLSGVIYSLERVPDPVFSQKLAGDGIFELQSRSGSFLWPNPPWTCSSSKEGLMMGTRSGDVDTSFHLFLHQQEQLTLWGDHRHSHEKEPTSRHIGR
jgi:Acetokinase family